MQKNTQKKAFSLIELSVVLIIIGLLVSGVSGGVKLVESARMNKNISSLTELRNNFLIFYNIYEALPGDMSNASEFFTSPPTINDGDGDGKIEWSAEAYNAPLHLAKAELVDDQGYTGTSSYFLMEIPSAEKTKQRITILHTTGHSNFPTSSASHNVLQVVQEFDKAAYTPKKAYYIDKKFDDGKPRTGEITVRYLADSTAATCQNNTTDYYLESDTIACMLIYNLDPALQ